MNNDLSVDNVNATTNLTIAGEIGLTGNLTVNGDIQLTGALALLKDLITLQNLTYQWIYQ